jgi:hypothetical protein
MLPQVRRSGAFFPAGALPVTPNVKTLAEAGLPGLENGFTLRHGVAVSRFAGSAVRAAFV